ncbi:hypothetical protein KP509_03G062200 [Ceratopteris richardii]|nr:hypothetical protein KP509_03G062200 [Ceratopteris richardii]
METRTLPSDLTSANRIVPAESKCRPRMHNPGSNKARGPLKYLNAKAMADKLLRAVTRDKALPAVVQEVDTNKQWERMVPNRYCHADCKYDACYSSMASSEQFGNIHHSLNPVVKVEDCRRYAESSCGSSAEIEGTHPVTVLRDYHLSHQGKLTKNQDAYVEEIMNDLDPLELRARTLEKQATTLDCGNGREERAGVLVGDEHFQYGTLDFDTQMLRKEFERLVDENRDLALEMAVELRARLSERSNAEQTLKRVRLDLQNKIKSMEREIEEMKARLQEQVEESEVEWASKYEKVKAKEKRLGERLKQVLEEKFELQREVSLLTQKKNVLVEELRECQESTNSFKEKAEDSTREVTRLRRLLEEATSRSNDKDEKASGRQPLMASDSEGWRKDGAKVTIRRYRDKERELMESQRAVGKLQKICREQEKTIAGLRFAVTEQTNATGERGEFFVKLQRELVRLTGVEQGLRTEVEGFKAQALAAKRENANLREKVGIMVKKLDNLDRELEQEDNAFVCRGNNGSIISVEPDEEVGAAATVRVEELESPENGDVRHESFSNQQIIRSSESLNHSMAIVPLKAKEAAVVHDPIISELELCYEEKEELEMLRGVVQKLSQTRVRLQEEACNLHNALSLTNRRVQELELQLENKEGELGDMQKQLSRVRGQRENLQKEADFMGREAIRLTTQVDQLQRRLEQLDEDVMVKDGQLCILRKALNE